MSALYVGLCDFSAIILIWLYDNIRDCVKDLPQEDNKNGACSLSIRSIYHVWIVPYIYIYIYIWYRKRFIFISITTRNVPCDYHRHRLQRLVAATRQHQPPTLAATKNRQRNHPKRHPRFATIATKTQNTLSLVRRHTKNTNVVHISEQAACS